ncbi:hypothetical protein D3C79_942790 [compost metagenome]
MLDQLAQAGAEDVLGQAEVALELTEALQAIEGITHDQQRPPVTNGVEGTGHRAFGVLQAGALDHGKSRQ